MNKLLSKVNIYTGLWCLYYLQGTLYPVGGGLSKSILAILVLWSVVYLFLSLRLSYKPAYIKGLYGMIFLYFFYWVLGLVGASGIGGMDNGSLVIKNICVSVLPIFAYIHFSNKNLITSKWLLTWLPFFVLVAISSFYHEQTSRLQLIMEEGGIRDEVVNNTGYLFVALIPYALFFHKKPVLQVLTILVCLAFAFMSLKRGAMLVASLSVVICILYRLKDNKNSNKVLTILAIIVAAIIAFNLFDSFLAQSDLLNNRLERTRTGDSSGRDEMWGRIYHYLIYENSLTGFFFGAGIGGTTKIIGDGAHNDWLQIAVDMGLLGISTYLIYWSCFFKSWRRLKRVDELLYVVLGIIFMTELLKTVFSFSFYSMPFYELPLLGYCIAIFFKVKSKGQILNGKYTDSR